MGESRSDERNSRRKQRIRLQPVFKGNFITNRKQSLRRLCFYTWLYVHRGFYPIACWDTPWAGTPLSRHPSAGQAPPGRAAVCTVHAEIRSTSGRYKSHWNAVLFYCCKSFDGNKMPKPQSIKSAKVAKRRIQLACLQGISASQFYRVIPMIWYVNLAIQKFWCCIFKKILWFSDFQQNWTKLIKISLIQIPLLWSFCLCLIYLITARAWLPNRTVK